MPNIDTLFAEFDAAFEEGFSKEFRNPIIKNLPLFAQDYFNNAKITIKNNFKFINNTKASTSSYDSKLFHFAKDLGYKITILYVNADGSDVINKYKDDTIKPKPDEIILFVEIKDNKINTGQIVRVKLGKNVMDDLIDRWFEIDVSPKELGNFLIKEIKELQKEASNDSNVVNSKKISTSDIRKPLIKAIENEFNKTKFDDVHWLVLILKGYTFNKIDAWLTKAASELRLLKIKSEGEDEKYWNGNLPKNKYEPFFIPKPLLEIDNLKQEDIEKVLNKPIQYLRELVDKKINKSPLVPRWAKDKIQSIIFNLEEQNKKYAKTIVEKLQISLDTLKHYNAYYVGIMNGILTFIADILDLVALIVIISKQELGFKLTDQLREAFENILNEAIYNTEKFKEQLDEQIMYLSINYANWFYRFENNSYFKLKQIGELVPEVLSAIISWLKVAKANKVASLAADLTKQEIKEIKEKLLKESVEEVVEKSKKETKEKLDEIVEKGVKKGDINKSFFGNTEFTLQKYLPKGKVLGQTKDNTCVANSLRMILDDVDITRTEKYLESALKTESDGVSIFKIPKTLSDMRIDNIETIIRGINKKDKTVFGNLVNQFKNSDNIKAIVSVKNYDLNIQHAIIIDKIKEGKVFIRDPLPLHQGSAYSINLNDFEKLFNDRFVIIQK